jgi:hypothetical protein
MRHLITAFAAIAVGGFLTSTTVRADPLYEPGGPAKIGDMCHVSDDQNGNDSFGYFTACPNQPVHVAKRTKKQKS